MIEHDEKIVDYFKYCKKCKYEKLKEEEEPCCDCLEETTNVNSRKPRYFEEKEERCNHEQCVNDNQKRSLKGKDKNSEK